ncbi:Calcineurin-like phosphoesterase [Gracilaria domingensis]|nr:Calcineurin-like phosphoesterase [Gracilaria domingensis]
MQMERKSVEGVNLHPAVNPLMRMCRTWVQSLLSSQGLCQAASCSDRDVALASLLKRILPSAHARALPPTESLPSLPPVAARFPGAKRIVAIGDVHGDVKAFRTALRSADILDKNDNWVGGETVLVQVGDVLDRGNHERAVYRILFKLQDTAPQSGGAVHILLGNHEVMNARMDFRYVSRAGFDDFRGVRGGLRCPPNLVQAIRSLEPFKRARALALAPGGSLAVELAHRARVAVIVGENVFVHAGLKKEHLMDNITPRKGTDNAINRLNERASTFLMGMGSLPQALRGSGSPIWMRDYSRPPRPDPKSEMCLMLEDTLKFLRAKRMIVGHTPQLQGINSACDGRVWRIDTGMSAIYGGVPEAFEINGNGQVRVYTPNGVVDGSERLR